MFGRTAPVERGFLISLPQKMMDGAMEKLVPAGNKQIGCFFLNQRKCGQEPKIPHLLKLAENGERPRLIVIESLEIYVVQSVFQP